MGVMKELKLREQLDEKLGKCEDEKISSGEAIEGMILTAW